MKRLTMLSQSKVVHSALQFSAKMMMAALFLVIANGAMAQHCPDGCTVNINGPTSVRVGDTVTYTVTPSAPQISYGAMWDDLQFLDGYAEILDQGQNGSGDEYITLRFVSAGTPWFTYLASYSCCHSQDFDEMELSITH